MEMERLHISSGAGLSLSREDLLNIAWLDNNVFCGEPWNEGTFCIDCGGMKTTIQSESCVNCGEQVISLETRAGRINRELVLPESQVVFAKHEGSLVGYAWGYVFDTPETFVQTKYETDTCRGTVLSAMYAARVTQSFYYYSGMGIDRAYRGKGLSHVLGKVIDDYARTLHLPGITRTLAQSPIVKMREHLGFSVIVGENTPYRDSENSNRVLMSRSI